MTESMAPKYTKKDLIDAVKNPDHKALLQLSSYHKTKRRPFSYGDVLKDFTKTEINQLFDDLNALLGNMSEALFDYKLENDGSSEKKKSGNEICRVIQAAVDIAFAVFDLKGSFCQGLLHMIVFLNGILIEIPDNMDNLKNSIAHLCEKLFHLNYVTENEYITFNTVMYLMRRTLVRKATKADVKRVYALRSIIPKMFGMDEVNSDDLWDLLKECAASPLYVSMPEGQKIIAMALALDSDHVAEIHDVIKCQLPSCSLKQSAGYGKAYFDAWAHAVKTESEMLKNELEITCLQDIILIGILTRQKSLTPILRKLLSQIHCHKKDQNVAKLLYFLYQPLLWRYLKNPDGLVRANACQIFLDIFPLEDPDVRVVTTDLELNEQLLMIKDLLLDDCPFVRSNAVIGTCIAMSLNWEIFPEEMLRTYFKIIVNSLSCDSSSVEVRCAVAKGMKVLLENPLTLSTLQRVLPKLQGLFHDIADSVRIAFCQLLLRVKKISSIKYFDIVPLNHLLARMEEDSYAVSKAIANLIHNSYFPKKEDPKIWLARCIEMIKVDRGASRIFFVYAPNFIGVESTVRFMIQVVKAIHFYVKTKACSKMTSALCSKSNKENIGSLNRSVTTLEEIAGFHDPHIVSGLLDSVIFMWLAALNHLEKPENKCYLKMLVGKLAKCLGDLSIYYKDTPVWESIYYLSSFLPSPNVPSLASLCFFRLKTLKLDAPSEEYMTLLECLCNQNQSIELLEVIKEWIDIGFSEALERPSKRRKVKKKVLKSQDLFQPKPALAVKMLNSLLDHRSCQKAILLRHAEFLKEFLNSVDVVKRKIEIASQTSIEQKDASFLKEFLFALLKISVLLQGEGKYNALEFVTELIDWIEEKLMQYVKELSDTNLTTDVFQDLTVLICKDVCNVTADMTLLGFVNAQSCNFLKFGQKVLLTGSIQTFLLPVCKLLFKHASYGHYIALESGNVDMLPHVPEIFRTVIQCLNNERLLEGIPDKEIKALQHLLANTLEMMHYQPNVLNEPTSAMLTYLAQTALGSFSSSIAKMDIVNELTCKPFDKLPVLKFGAFLLSVVCLKFKSVAFYINYFHENYMKSVSDMQSWITCCVVVFSILDTKHIPRNVFCEMENLMVVLDKILRKLCPRRKEFDTDKTSSPEITSAGNSSEATSEDISPEKLAARQECFERHCCREFQRLQEVYSQKTRITRTIQKIYSVYTAKK